MKSTIYWFIERLIDGLIDWSFHRLIDWLIDWSFHWLIDRLSVFWSLHKVQIINTCFMLSVQFWLIMLLLFPFFTVFDRGTTRNDQRTSARFTGRKLIKSIAQWLTVSIVFTFSEVWIDFITSLSVSREEFSFLKLLLTKRRRKLRHFQRYFMSFFLLCTFVVLPLKIKFHPRGKKSLV